jgi:membrane-bound lytic murein transglycosylase D
VTSAQRRGESRSALDATAFALALLLAVLATPGCSVSTKPPVVTPEQQVSPPPGSTAPVSGDVALLTARAHQAASEQARASGDLKLAREELERALRALEESAGGADPSLREMAQEIQGEVKALLEDGGISSEGIDADQEEGEPSPLDELESPPPPLTPLQIEYERGLIDLSHLQFDIPITVNERVLAWVNFYTHAHREKFEAGLVRSGRYLPMIHRIFSEEGIPKDLAYMAHVESAYKPNAYSRAKAKGIFQFIRGTGVRYGLRVDRWIDERSDPEKATRAAAAYLKDLYAMFGDWYLALAAYNAGEGKISRVIAATGQTDFWKLVDRRVLRAETNNYVPAIIAATLISREPRTFGFDFVPDPPLEYDTMSIQGPLHLRAIARAANTSLEAIAQLNPAVRRQSLPNGTHEVRVPPGSADAVRAGLQTVPAADRTLDAYHKVRKGETLSRIARQHGVTTAAIQRANGMGKRTTLRVGETLSIPDGSEAVAERAPRTAPSAAKATATVYRVRPGDTLYAIARRHGTTPQALAAANGIPTDRMLQVGQVLKLTSTASVASTESPAVRGVHTVRRGETLARIAGRYKITVDELCAANNITRHETIYPGTKLTVPAP